MTNTTEAAYEYTGYGEITQTQGTLTQPYGYTGREWDAESGLYHYRARAYDPKLGLFIQNDPIGFAAGQLSLYGYVGADPFGWSDPSGATANKEYSRIHGKGGANGIMATTKIFKAAIDHLFRSLEVFHGSLSTDELRDSKGRKYTASCDHNQLSDYTSSVNDSKGGPGTGKNSPRACMAMPIRASDRTIIAVNHINLRRMQRWQRLYMARYTREKMCFNGGNENHKKEYKEAMKHMQKCWGFIHFNSITSKKHNPVK